MFNALGPEYGTTEAAWKGILTESERVSELHMNIKDQLCNDVMQQIRVWQKDNYHKVSFNVFLRIFKFLTEYFVIYYYRVAHDAH